MPTLSIVNPYDSNAMRRHIDPLIEHTPDVWSMWESPRPDPAAAVLFHVPWHSLVDYEPPAGQRQVMLYTHCNPGAEADLRKAAAKADHIITVSKEGERELAHYCPGMSTPVTTITPPVDLFPMRKVRVAIIGSEQPNGRKRSWLLTELAWRYDLSPFHFYIVGTGWEPVLAQAKNMGVDFEYHEHLPHEALLKIYQGVDVVLATGFREGGPLPVIEALACGTPVLAPPYGLALEYGNDAMIYRNDEELMAKLDGYAANVRKLHQTVEHLTAERYAATHFAIFQPSVTATTASLTLTVTQVPPIYQENGRSAVAPA